MLMCGASRRHSTWSICVEAMVSTCFVRGLRVEVDWLSDVYLRLIQRLLHRIANQHVQMCFLTFEIISDVGFGWRT